MKKFISHLTYVFLLITSAASTTAFYHQPKAFAPFKFPYREAGLTDREAAAHLLSRFSFGIKPGQVDEVVKTGLENWFDAQLRANFSDSDLDRRLANFESLKMTNEEIVKTYPKPAQVLRLAVRDGVIDRDSVKIDKKEYRDQLQTYLQQNGMKPQAELLRQLANQKILRAAYSQNQLQEVLTDFWFNHFNVAGSKNGVQQFLTSYERDAIRPNALGNFETLLLATAKSPAMLIYLDNDKSTVNEENMVDQQKKFVKARDKIVDAVEGKIIDKMQDSAMRENATVQLKRPRMQGLNENYAREIMELHTLGVDGGYTQQDVTQAARVLTGWSLNPIIENGFRPKQMPNIKRLEKQGFVIENDFVFAAQKHDFGEKKVLGHTFAAGVGYNEGIRLIHMLATHPSTAKFISKKLAVRFVSDAPPQSLVDKMAKTFLSKNGDIKEVLITMVTAPEFWSRQALREKTKSPFELAISAVRATNADVIAPFQLFQWTAKMGQRMYNYQAPTGFPDKGQYWINTGSLLNRMNFGLAFASGKIPGVRTNLLALNNNHEPESAEQALRIYSKVLLPERDAEETVRRLIPMLTDPELQKKIENAAEKTKSDKDAGDDEAMMDMRADKGVRKIGGRKNGEPQIQYTKGNNSMLGQVVGIILGSPEFQRR